MRLRAAFWDFMRHEMMHYGVRMGLDETDGLSGVYAICRRKMLCSCCAYIAINLLYSLSIAGIGDTG
jgi:hypothetical protein